MHRQHILQLVADSQIKKLEAVADHWGRLVVGKAPSSSSDEFEADMAAFGLSDEVVNAQRKVKEDVCEIWVENIDTVDLFFELASKWYTLISFDGQLIRLGIRGHEIDLALKYKPRRIKKRASEIFNEIVFMEKIALSAMNDVRLEQSQKEA